MASEIPRLEAFRDDVRAAGITRAILMGMGGSSLAPEGFATVFGGEQGLRLDVIDSTDPDMIRERSADADPRHTLYLVATKSGGTVETLSAFKHFYRAALASLGKDAGAQFVAITDPGSALDGMAQELGFRDVFTNDPTIGGRFSALSFFGLVPAVLVGVDLARLLARGADAAGASYDGSVGGEPGDAGVLGAALAALAQQGRDKLTLSASSAIEPIVDWIEQLVAESTGKEGRGIVPVVREALMAPPAYAADRVFVDLKLGGDNARVPKLEALAEAGHPVFTLDLRDRYDLGAQFFLWEMATAVAGAGLDVHPFDQPNVEAAKVAAKQAVARFAESGELASGDVPTVHSAPEVEAFLNQVQTGGYVSLHAYVNPTPDMDRALARLRRWLQAHYRVATTVGYGPRLLHSTGQLHKGDAGRGVFLQFLQDPQRDVPIPDEPGSDQSSLSFAVLERAQALGDAQALQEGGRAVARYLLGERPVAALVALIERLEEG